MSRRRWCAARASNWSPKVPGATSTVHRVVVDRHDAGQRQVEQHPPVDRDRRAAHAAAAGGHGHGTAAWLHMPQHGRDLRRPTCGRATAPRQAATWPLERPDHRQGPPVAAGLGRLAGSVDSRRRVAQLGQDARRGRPPPAGPGGARTWAGSPAEARSAAWAPARGRGRAVGPVVGRRSGSGGGVEGGLGQPGRRRVRATTARYARACASAFGVVPSELGRHQGRPRRPRPRPRRRGPAAGPGSARDRMSSTVRGHLRSARRTRPRPQVGEAGAPSARPEPGRVDQATGASTAARVAAVACRRARPAARPGDQPAARQPSGGAAWCGCGGPPVERRAPAPGGRRRCRPPSAGRS